MRSIGAAAVEEDRCTAEEAARLREGAAAAAAAYGGRYTVEECGRAALAFAVHEALKGFELPGADGGAAVWHAIEALCPSDARDGVKEAFKLRPQRDSSTAVRRAARLLIGITSKSRLVKKSLDNASMSVVSAALHSALGVQPHVTPGREAPYEAGANDVLNRVCEAAAEHKAACATAAAAAAAAHV